PRRAASGRRIGNEGRTEAMAAISLGRNERGGYREIPRADAIPATRRRGYHQHARTLRAMAPDPDGGNRIFAADRVCQRGQPHARSRDGATARDIAEDCAGSACFADRKTGVHPEHGALVIWRRGGLGDRIRWYALDSAFRVPPE